MTECSLFDKYAIHTAKHANSTPARIIHTMNAAEVQVMDPLPLSCRAVINSVHEARYTKQPNKSNCFQVIRPWYLKSGQKRRKRMRMVPPTGILNQNTQRQVEWVVIMPPTTGPLFQLLTKPSWPRTNKWSEGKSYRTADTTVTPPINPLITAIFSGGVTSGRIIRAIEYNPAPPIPCKARKAISCWIVWAQPQPIENAVMNARAYLSVSIWHVCNR